MRNNGGVPAIKPPVMPQLALSRAALPEGEEWSYEPKWDGFRAIAFVDPSGETFLQSRNGKPLSRYFPELEFPAGDYVLDGELVIFGDEDKQEFELLQQRIHPAESRIKRLAEETPVRFVAFDLLAADGEALLDEPFAHRRKRLEKLVAQAARPDALDHGPCRRGAVAAGRRGGDRQGAERALSPRRAQGDGEGEAAADDRRRDRGLAAGQGRGHARVADPRSIRRGR